MGNGSSEKSLPGRPASRRARRGCPAARVILGILLPFAGIRLFSAAAGPVSKLAAQDLLRNLKNKTFSGDRIDLRFADAGLIEILNKFQEVSGLVFKVGPAVDPAQFPPRRYNFLGHPWDRALDAVLTDFGLELRLRGGALWVDPFTPEGDKAIPAFLIGSLTAAAAAGAAIWILAWRRRRRRAQERERKITLDPEAVDNAIQRLKYMFQVEKAYRNGRLSLDSLAERLNLQPYQLSGIINSRMGKSFTEFVADYRIDDVKKRLADPGESANILNIAYDAGFGTKASFNRIFKERTGLTPSEFRRKTPADK